MTLFRCLFLSVLFLTPHGDLLAQQVNRSEYGPFSLQAALQRFHLHPDFRIELVAAEPDVIDPVDVAFDLDGKLWVVEMSDYPNGPGEAHPGLSRIRVLTDMDGDGLYSQPITFAEKLLFANGLMFWKDGVLVTTDGKLQWMRDVDGDGACDETHVWFRGFAIENPQLRHNHPQLGIDGKIYVANGLRGGEIVPGPENPWGLDTQAKPLNIAGQDFRFDPLTGEYEAIAGMGQFGMTFDRYGNRFVCTNRNPCRQIVLENEQLRRTPGLKVARHYEDVAPAGEDSRLFPLSRTWTTSNLHANQFTAACGVRVHYFDRADSHWGGAYTCDPTANLVHFSPFVAPVWPVQWTRHSTPNKEFLATTDEWFRPVNLATGPDEALYVVDMYRAVIEHPQFMPAELKQRPDLLLGRDRGRIWRISHVDSFSPVTITHPNTSELLQSAFQAEKDRTRFWLQQHAFRLLLESEDPEITPQLREVLRSKTSTGTDHAKVLTLLRSTHQSQLADLAESLQRIGITPELLKRAAEEFPDDPQWTRLINQTVEKRLAKYERQATAAFASGDRHVCQTTVEPFYALLSEVPWAELSPSVRSTTLALLLESVIHTDMQYWLSAYLGVSAGEQADQLLTDLLSAMATLPITPAETTQLVSVIQPIAELAARQNAKSALETILTTVATREDLSASTKMAVLAGLSSGAPLSSTAFRRLVNSVFAESGQDVSTLMSAAARSLLEDDTPRELQSILTTMLSIDVDPATQRLLLELTGAGDAELASLSLQALLRRPAEDVNPALVDVLNHRRGRVRREMIQAFAANAARAKLLLDEIEAERVAVTEVDSTVERLLRRHTGDEYVARLNRLISREPPADRVQVLKEYQACLTLVADPLRGQVVFEKNCATCHKIGEVGVNVAPDISDSRTKQPSDYLTSILDPNRAIDANYFSHTVLDTQGKVYTGIIVAETSSTLTLKMPEAKTVTLARDEIEEIKNNGVSLMPVGLERTIDQQQMADLISFIKNWRYLNGQVPPEVIQ